MLSITSIGVTDLNKKVKSLFKSVITQQSTAYCHKCKNLTFNLKFLDVKLSIYCKDDIEYLIYYYNIIGIEILKGFTLKIYEYDPIFLTKNCRA